MPVQTAEDRVRRLGLGECRCGAPILEVQVSVLAGEQELRALCMRGHWREDYKLPPPVPPPRTFSEAHVKLLLLHANIRGWRQCREGLPAPSGEELLASVLEKCPDA